MRDKLYIIGNGFDLHHGIPSSYGAFGGFLQSNDRKTYELVQRYFFVDSDFWSEFEERLAFFDADTLTDDASHFLVGYGAEDWSDSYHHDYEYEIGNVVSALSVTLRVRFAEWVRQLPIPMAGEVASARLDIDPSAIFLNFNYTDSLQRIYGVPDQNILYIHGSGSDIDAKLILGHGWKQKEHPDPYRFAGDPEGADIRVVGGQRLIDGYFADTFKPTCRIIKDKADFFAGLASITTISVMGHSLSDVDLPYFQEIIKHIHRDRVRWRVSYFASAESVRSRFDALNINPGLTQFLPLADF